MATNHTENYNLNLWEPTDAFLREEFNQDNAKIDAALLNHRAGELIASVTVEEETNSLELDISTVDWSRYAALMLYAESENATGYKISMTSSSEACMHLVSKYSSVSSDYNAAYAPYSRIVTMIVPVLYDGDHAPLVFLAGHGIYTNSSASEFSCGGGTSPLKQCRAVSLNRRNGSFQPGDRAVLWGIK